MKDIVCGFNINLRYVAIILSFAPPDNQMGLIRTDESN